MLCDLVKSKHPWQSSNVPHTPIATIAFISQFWVSNHEFSYLHHFCHLFSDICKYQSHILGHCGLRTHIRTQLTHLPEHPSYVISLSGQIHMTVGLPWAITESAPSCRPDLANLFIDSPGIMLTITPLNLQVRSNHDGHACSLVLARYGQLGKVL
jgi:hypothetical protein